jgi:ppGpp synthetase/RelA/SpoT-type nucleotidyltranferase
MTEYGLDIHCTMLLEDYRDLIPKYRLLQQVVMEKLGELVKKSGIELNSMESRIKTEKSLAGKLQRKGSKYQSIYNITDIIGARIITFYNEDVDRIASMAETLFDIDWSNSIDKRKMHQYDSFGYNSLHYICKLPKTLYYNEKFPELNDIPFELQMRTALQHVWSAIQHDIGYKNDIEIPIEYHRNLSRLAGMLELADNEFSRIRTDISDYRRRIESLVKDGKLEEIPLDGDTFRSYMDMQPFDKLNKQIAAITQAELLPATPMSYLHLLREMGMNTLGDIERLIKENSDDAYQLALFQLGATDIDILSSNIGIQNICIVYILKNDGGKLGLRWMFDIINGNSEHNNDMAQIILEQASKLSFMNKQ